LNTLKSLTNNPHEILAQLQIIKNETNRLWRSRGEVVAKTYKQDEFRKIIDPILQKKGLKVV
jgi:hypothetical protein